MFHIEKNNYVMARKSAYLYVYKVLKKRHPYMIVYIFNFGLNGQFQFLHLKVPVMNWSTWYSMLSSRYAFFADPIVALYVSAL